MTNKPLKKGEPPNDYVSKTHEYDIDIVSSYYNIKRVLFSESKLKIKIIEDDKKKEYLKGIRYAIISYCNNHEIDFDFHFKHHIPIIIPSDDNYYINCLALSLIFCDLFKINSLLQYQKQKYIGDENFLDLIEFRIYELIKKSPFILERKRHKYIMKWVELERIKEIPQNKKSCDQNTIEEQINLENRKEINIDPNVIEKLVKALSFYFHDENPKNLANCLKGKKIDKKLLFMSNSVKLVGLFSSLKDSNKIRDKQSEINKWICQNFLYLDNNKKTHPFNQDYVKKILTGQQSISKKSRIKLDD